MDLVSSVGWGRYVGNVALLSCVEYRRYIVGVALLSCIGWRGACVDLYLEYRRIHIWSDY